jgi:hypothetical protein
LAMASTLAAVGCGALLGLEGPDGVSFPLAEAGTDTQVGPDVRTDSAPSGPDECLHLTVPPRNGDDDPDAANNKVGQWIALRTVDLAPDAAPGFDLDETCTGFQGPTARDGLPSCNGRGIIDPKDYQDGVDNAVFSSFERNELPGTDSNSLYPYTTRASQGLAAILVLLYDYNGKANDAEVRVGFARAFGIQTDEGCDGGPRGLIRTPASRVEYDPAFDAGPDARVDSTEVGDGGTLRRFANGFPPAWDGCDKWMLNSADLGDDPNVPPYPATQFKGYVSNYQLVVQDDGTFPLGNRFLPIAQRTMVGKLLPRTDDAGNLLRQTDLETFTVAGRIGLDEAIAVLGTFESNGVQFCKLGDLFNRSAVDLCNSLDLAANRSLDHKDRPCGAISFGIAIKGVSAKVEPNTVSRRFLPRPEVSACERLPSLDEKCQIIPGAK